MFIDGIHLRKTADARLTAEDWFDGQQLKFNADLVAVIGSKGSGKSALADIVALLGDTPSYENFSFLTSNRFRERKNNRAIHFEGEIRWTNGLTKTRRLSENPQAIDIERVRYIPQRYFETVCAGQSEENITEFTDQVERVIFSHIPLDLRGNSENLQELLRRQETEATIKIERLRTEIRQLNREIRDTTRKTSLEVQQHLEATRILREQQLADLQAAKPPSPPAARPASESTGADATSAQPDLNLAILTAAQNLHSSLTDQLEAGRQSLRNIQDRLAAAERVDKALKNFRESYNNEIDRLGPDALLAGVDLQNVITLKYDEEALANKVQAITTELAGVRTSVDGPSEDSIASKLGVAATQVQQARLALNEQQLAVQLARERFEHWEQQVAVLNGGPDVASSIASVLAQIEVAMKGPERIAELDSERAKKVRAIAQELLVVRDARTELVEKARKTIDAVVPKHDNFSLGFINELSLSNSLEDQFFEHVKQVSGTFRGEDEGRRAFREFVESHALTSAEDVYNLAKGLELKLINENKGSEIITHDLENLVRRGKTPEDLLDLLFCLGYVQPHFSLAQAGQPLNQLSPGQRGALLLMFYLLVEDSDLPLVLDQPEENLDNETVYALLVPAIKQAKARRQIIMVTHNANLAVCCDAEQIIQATSNKGHRHTITYRSGPLEEPEINKVVVDVLEGTRPAFDSRSSTYWV